MKKHSPEWWAALPPERVGKETEILIESLFKVWNRKLLFAWHRLPDAKAARGRLAAQPADFMYRYASNSGFLEVKALKHAFRLPAERVIQLPTLLKWNLAGSKNFVLVHHYMEGVWRVVSPTQLETGVPSWDLREFPTFPTAEAALISTGVFPCQS